MIFIAVGISVVISCVLSFYLARKFYAKGQSLAIEQAQIKANAIEKEAEINYQNSQIKLKEQEIELQKRYEIEERKLLDLYNKKALELEERDFNKTAI